MASTRRTLTSGSKKERDSSQFRFLFEKNPLPMWVYDLETLQFLEVNLAALQNYGYSRDEFLRLRISDIRPSEGVARLIKHVKGQRTALQHSGEWRHRRKDGSVIDVEITSHKLSYEGHKAALVVAQDITERIQAEQEVARSLSLLQATLDSTADGILVVDRAGKIVSFNQRFVEIWGIPESVMAARDDEKALAHILDKLKEPEAFIRKVRDLYAHPRDESFDRLEFKDGRHLERYSRPQRLNRTIVGRVWSFREVTEQKKAAASIQASEARYRSVVENSLTGLSIFQGVRLLFANPAICEMLGYSADELKEFSAEQFVSLLHPEGLAATISREQARSRGEQAPPRSELRVVRKDGSLRWLEASTSTIEYEGSLCRLVSTIDVTERKLAEESLLRSEAKYRSVVENSIQGISIFQGNRLAFVNPAICEILGYPAGELLALSGEQFFSLVHPDDRAASIAREAARSRGEATANPFQYRTVRKDGTVRWLESFLSDIDYEGRPSRLSCTIDITERKEAEAALSKSESRFRALVEQLPAVVYINPPDDPSSTLYVSPQIESILGYTPDEWMADPKLWSKRLHPEDRQAVLAQADHLSRTGEPFAMEYRMVRRDGQVAWVRDQVALARDPEGRPQFWQGLMIDITERRQVEDALLESETKYRSLFEHVPDGVYRTSPEGKILAANPSLVSMLGYDSEAELLSANVSPGIYADPGQREENIRILMETDELRNVEINLRRKDGQLIVALDNSRSIRDETGQPLFFEGTLTDITERKRAEEALRVSELELRALFAAMPDVILVYDKDGRYLRVVTNNSDLLYRPQEEMLGKRLEELFSKPKADEFLGYIQAALETRSAVRFEYELLIRGRIVWFSGAVSAITDDTVVWVARDITAQKRAEEQIQRRLIEQEALYENGLALSRALDPTQIAECVIQVLEKHLDWHHAAVRLLRNGSDQIQLLAFSHAAAQRADGKDSQSLAQAAITRVGQGMVGWVLEHARAINSRDLKNDPRYHPTFPGMESGLYVPIWAGGHVIGCISVESGDADGFTEDDERLLTTLAAQAAAAFENARLFAQTQRRAEEFASLYQTARDISAQSDLDLLLKAIVERSAALLNVSTSGIYLYDPSHNDLYVAVNVGLNDSLGYRLGMGEGVAGRVAESREPLIIDDYQKWEGRSPKYEGEPIRAVLEVPMVYRGELIGVLTVDELGDSNRKFTEDESRLLSMFASHAASAIHNSRLLAQTTRRAEELGIFAQVSSALRTAATRAEMEPIILDQVIELLKADGAFLVLRVPGTEDGVIEKTRGTAQALEGMRLPSQSITGRILASGQRYVNADVRTDPNMFVRDALGDTRAAAGIPLTTQELTIGVLWVQRNEKNVVPPNGFAENELSLLTSIADMAANALQRSALHEETLRYAEQLEVVNDLGRILAETLDLQKIYERLAKSALDLLPDSAGLFISLFHPQTELITAAYGIADGEPVDVAGLPPMALTPLGEGNQSTVIRTGRPLVVGDLNPSYEKGTPKSVIVGTDGPLTQSGVFVPMISQGQVIGVLQLQSYTSGRYNDADAELLALVANTAAVAIQNASLYDETRRRVTQLATLNELGRAISEHLDLESVFKTTLDQLKQNLPLDVLSISLLDLQTQIVTFPFIYDDGQRYDVTSTPLAETTFIREVIEKGVPILRSLTGEQVAADQADPATPRIGDRSRISASLIFAPLVLRSQIVGAISVQSYDVNAYTQDHLQLVVGFANQVAIAIQNGRLFNQLDQRVEQLSALHSIDTAISSSTDLGVSLNVVLESLIRQLNVHAADVLLLSPVTHLLEYAAGLGFKYDYIKRAALHLGEGFAGRVAQTRRMIQIPDFANTEHDTARRQLIESEHFVSYVGVPLIAKGVVKGVLEVFHRAPLQSGEDWLAFLDVLAREAAIAIDNALLFQSLDRANTELTLAYDATITGWSQALELRDQETHGHASHLAELTLQLAGAVGIPESQLLHIRRGVLLHDIGNMAVPDQILHKIGPLNKVEWEVLRKHPENAFKMLSPITYLRSALDIPYCHHEKWDGSGYPRGLKAESIPLAARLFAVVDVYDALTSDRPYRKAWPTEKALGYIQEQSGKQFDPRIVKAFLEHIESTAAMGISTR